MSTLDSLIYDRRMQLLTYLNYGGNCAEAFRFYEQHLGGRITMMMKHGEAPGQSQVPPGLEGGVLHAWDPLESTCRHASLSIL